MATERGLIYVGIHWQTCIVVTFPKSLEYSECTHPTEINTIICIHKLIFYQGQKSSHLPLVQKLSDIFCFLHPGTLFAKDKVTHEALLWFYASVVRSKETMGGVWTHLQMIFNENNFFSHLRVTNEPVCVALDSIFKLFFPNRTNVNSENMCILYVHSHTKARGG